MLSGGIGDGMQQSDYFGCVFDGCYLRGISPGRARFVECSFRDVKIFDFKCFQAEFVDCVFSGSLRTVIFDARVDQPDDVLGRTRNEFHGNDFRNADLEDVAFRGGIDMAAQALPTGPEYLLVRDAPAALSRARDVVQRWPEDEYRRDAMLTLEVWEGECRTGQQHILLKTTR